jgi:ribosomal protein L3
VKSGFGIPDFMLKVASRGIFIPLTVVETMRKQVHSADKYGNCSYKAIETVERKEDEEDGEA